MASRLDHAIAVVFTPRGDQHFPETQEELQRIIDGYKYTCECIVFSNPRWYGWTRKPLEPEEVKLP